LRAVVRSCKILAIPANVTSSAPQAAASSMATPSDRCPWAPR
jgi:hypothetical protein